MQRIFERRGAFSLEQRMRDPRKRNVKAQRDVKVLREEQHCFDHRLETGKAESHVAVVTVAVVTPPWRDQPWRRVLALGG